MVDYKVKEDNVEIRYIKKKIIIIGQGGVGKTTLLYRYMNNVFFDSTKMTIGSDFFIKKLNFQSDGIENRITMLLWDFAGQERFRFILKDYIKGTEAILLAFNLNRVITLHRLHDWIDILKETKEWKNPNKIVYLIGTKKDLFKNDPSNLVENEISKFQEEFNISNYYATSALDGTGIEELFQDIAKSIITQ